MCTCYFTVRRRRLAFPRGRWLVLIVFLCLGPAPAVANAQAPTNSRQLRALAITEPVVVDGVLKEVVWSQAEVARDFTQQQPDEGTPATDRTEIRVLYDTEALYVGGTFFDTNPRRAISNELTRDFRARDGDLITVVLDTFHDMKNAFNFMINPAGALRDSQSYDDGRQNNPDWDGVWYVKTAFFPDRWSMEMRIPFRTLRFRKADEQVWGFNVFRLVRRKNEISFWSPVPRQFTQFRTSFAGILTGIRGVNPGRDLQIKPYVIAEGTGGTESSARWGADVKYGLGSASRLDLTYRTDFAQVEQDEQQINLTRFSLFLPEKREFFLENQGVFRIGDIDQATGVRSPLVPFFSRRIGLSPAGQPLPILGGGRLSGHFGSWRVGLLDLQTDPESGSGDNFFAVRVAKDAARFGSYSLFYFGREVAGPDAFNRVVGGDIHLAPRPTVDIDLFVLGSSSAMEGRGTASRASLNVRERNHTGHLSFTHLGESFRNDLGFVPRPNVNLLSWQYQRHIRPRARRLPILTYTAGAERDVYWSPSTSALETRTVKALGRLEFADGSMFLTDVTSTREHLTRRFTIAGLGVDPGEYAFTQVSASFESDRSRVLTGNIGITTGQYWSGRLKTMEAGVRARLSKHLAVAGVGSRSELAFGPAESNLTLLRLRADCSFSTTMFLSAFAQYSSERHTWTSNVRFRFTYRPLSDLFVVYSSVDSRDARPVRSLAVKSTLLLGF